MWRPRVNARWQDVDELVKERFPLCCVFITAQCHSWICSVFSIAAVKHSSCIGKAGTILPSNRKSAVLIWQHQTKFGFSGCFPVEPDCLLQYCWEFATKGESPSCFSFYCRGALGCWPQPFPATQHTPSSPPLPPFSLLNPSPDPLLLLCNTFPLRHSYTLYGYDREMCWAFTAYKCLSVRLGWCKIFALCLVGTEQPSEVEP